MADPTAFVRHNHNDGKALPFGRLKPSGECPRCDELRAGATPREAPHGIREAKAAEAEDARRAAEIREHFASGEHLARCQQGNPTAPTTCYDW